MRTITVHLLKPGKNTTVSYQGQRLRIGPDYMLIHALWERDALDLGYVVFEPGDHFYEYYYSSRWFNIFEIRDTSGVLKGWYCNVTRPAQIAGDLISSEDLEIDLFVPPDREHMLTLDMDEFMARGFAETDPPVYQAALAALDELKRMVRAGEPPFNTV